MSDALEYLRYAYTKFGAFMTAKIEDAKVFQDEFFTFSKRFSIASSGVVDIVIDPTGITKDFLVSLPVTFKAIGSGPVDIDFYFGATAADDGTLIGCTNRNSTSSETCGLVVRLGATVSATGVKVSEDQIQSNGVAAVATSGGTAADDYVFNARLDGKYLYRLTNTGASPVQVVIKGNWFEVTPKTLEGVEDIL